METGGVQSPDSGTGTDVDAESDFDLSDLRCFALPFET